MGITSAGYYLGRRRAFSKAGGRIHNLHFLPSYYGFYAALWAAIPALLVFAMWLFMEGTVITQIVLAALPDELKSLPPDRLNLVLNDIRNLVSGNIVSGEVSPAIQAAADHYANAKAASRLGLTVLVVALALGGTAWAWREIRAEKRARNVVESAVTIFLIAASTIAIMTTLGIV